MNIEEIRGIWARHLAGEKLDDPEVEQLSRALEGDPGFRERALADLDMHGLLRSLERVESEGDEFARSFRSYLSRERDATRFIKKLETRIGDERFQIPAEPARDPEGREEAGRHRRIVGPRHLLLAILLVPLDHDGTRR